MSTEPNTTGISTDSSPYIRTYAKDFAELAAKNPELAAANRAMAKKSRPQKENKPVEAKKNPWHLSKQKSQIESRTSLAQKPKEMSSLDAIANDLDAQTQGQVQGEARPPEAAEEAFELPKIAQGDIIAAQPEKPIVSAPPAFTTPEPSTTFVETASAPNQEPAFAAPGNEDRAAILARLKERVAAHEVENPVQPIAPVSVSNMMPRHEVAPVMPVTPEPAVEPPPVFATPLAAPGIPAQIPVPAAESPSPIHTYTSDFADRIDTQHASTFSVLAAEKDAPAPRRVPAPQKKKAVTFLPVVIGIVLLLVGAGAVFGAYEYMSKNTPPQSVLGPPSLINPDEKVELKGTGSTLMSALATKASEPLPNGNVLLTYVNESTTTSEGVVEQQATGGAFVTSLNLSAPDILLRNIEPASMVGIVHAGNETRPFFILSVDSYERTFAGMLQWEPGMLNSLGALYPLYPATSAPNSTITTGTSTAPIFLPAINSNTPNRQFIDEVVSNHSARVLRDSGGRTLILYGYADKQTLIIDRDEASFTLLLGRLAASNK